MTNIKEVKTKSDSKTWTLYGPELYFEYKNYVPHLKQDIEKVFNPEKNSCLYK